MRAFDGFRKCENPTGKKRPVSDLQGPDIGGTLTVPPIPGRYTNGEACPDVQMRWDA